MPVTKGVVLLVELPLAGWSIVTFGAATGPAASAVAPEQHASAPSAKVVHRQNDRGCPLELHDDGQGIGLAAADPMQASLRMGNRPRRTTNRVYLPISPGLEIRIWSTTPGRQEALEPTKFERRRTGLPGSGDPTL